MMRQLVTSHLINLRYTVFTVMKLFYWTAALKELKKKKNNLTFFPQFSFFKSYSLTTWESCEFLLLPCFIEIPVVNANSADPDQRLHPAASELGLHVCQCPFLGTVGINVLIT